MDRRDGDDLSAALIGLIGTRGPLSRADAARALKVSPARVTTATKELIDSGVLAEAGTVPSGGGRPAILLDLARGSRSALGVKVTPNHLSLAVVDVTGEVGSVVSHDLDMRAPDSVERVVDLVADAVARHDGLLGVGFALPGSVEAQDPGVVTSAILGWHKLALGAMTRNRIGLPVFIDNDVNALAIAARLYEGQPADDYTLVTVGYGIGCALLLGGRVYHGAHGGAGELGHINIQPDGPLCECGLRGCLEALIGDNALARRALDLGATATASKSELNLAAQRGVPAALELFESAGATLGRAVASLVHLTDPELVVVSGEGVDVWEFWEPGFTRSLRECLPRHRRDLLVVARAWGDDTWARGAASLVFASPLGGPDGVGSSGRRVRTMLREGL